jgi:Spy/CpxP family protein refolding chaperone
MRLIPITLLGVAVTLASAALAQHAGHGQHTGHGQHRSAYADLAMRPIKALSEDQVGDLKAGRGMGLSLPAELNGYPGPKHVLELADQIGLSAAQRQTTSQLIDAMSAEAVALGIEIIAQEGRLESLFADHKADADQTRAVVDRIGAAQASLRFVHLKYHLAMRTALTAEQIEKYAGLRGYTSTKQ